MTLHATLELPGARRRLDRIAELVARCQHSFHDLSRVQTSGPAPRLPRFNMPFELGIAVGQRRRRNVLVELSNALVRVAEPSLERAATRATG